VEVEVIRNAFTANEAEPVSSTFHGAEATVHRTIGAYMDRLKNVPHEIETEVAEAEHVVSDDAKEIGHKKKRAMPLQSNEKNDEDERICYSKNSRKAHQYSKTLMVKMTVGDAKSS